MSATERNARVRGPVRVPPLAAGAPPFCARLLVAGWLAAWFVAAAQPAPVITDSDITRARERHRMPTEAQLSRVPGTSTPRIDALPQPATTPRVDIEAIARGFSAESGPAAFAIGPALFVFVSFAMPEPSLSRLVDQAARAGATLVLRGFVDGSLRETVARMQSLIGSRRVAAQIDPEAFDRYAIGRTPSFVLLRSGASSRPCGSTTCVAPDGFVLAAGDVSLDYALEQFQRSAPGMSNEAVVFLRRMRGSPR